MVTPRVLVTGAEGLVGSAVVPHLLAYGHPVSTLTLPGAEPHEGVRVVRGDARDAAAVRDALDGVDAVCHLAAIPDPYRDPAPVVFANNTQATFTVLWTAAEAGVRRFAIASSVNATGLPMNPALPVPARFPLDEGQPPDIADPYSLGKQVDEHTLRAVCRRFGAAGVALRMPLVVAAGQARRRDLGGPAAGDGWSWLDARDAAEAFRLALTRDLTGPHVVLLAAAETLEERPTGDLLAELPEVPAEGDWPGRAAPVDTTRALELLGWAPRYAVADPPP